MSSWTDLIIDGYVRGAENNFGTPEWDIYHQDNIAYDWGYEVVPISSSTNLCKKNIEEHPEWFRRFKYIPGKVSLTYMGIIRRMYFENGDWVYDPSRIYEGKKYLDPSKLRKGIEYDTELHEITEPIEYDYDQYIYLTDYPEFFPKVLEYIKKYYADELKARLDELTPAPFLSDTGAGGFDIPGEQQSDKIDYTYISDSLL